MRPTFVALTTLLTAAAFVACLDQPAPCDDGSLCGGGLVCAPLGGCATPARLEACVDKLDGDDCAADFGAGICSGGACLSSRCGDGRQDADELCDDGNAADGDGCARDCRSDETCGNGIRDAGEGCDDGDTTDGDGCQGDCTLPGCGDGIVDPAEACDDGNLASGDGCAGNCVSTEACGNA